MERVGHYGRYRFIGIVDITGIRGDVTEFTVRFFLKGGEQVWQTQVHGQQNRHRKYMTYEAVRGSSIADF
jgi:hypothetical protein